MKLENAAWRHYAGALRVTFQVIAIGCLASNFALIPAIASEMIVSQVRLPNTDRALSIATASDMQMMERSSLQPMPLLVVLHYGGYNRPFYGADILRQLFIPAFGNQGFVMVAPDCPHGTWTAPDCTEAIADAVGYAKQTFNIAPNQVVLAGYSMGGIGTWHHLVRNQDAFSAGIVISASVSQDVKSKTHETPIFVLHGLQDELFDVRQVEASIDELRDAGADINLVTLPDASHFEVAKFVEPLSQALPWLERLWRE